MTKLVTLEEWQKARTKAAKEWDAGQGRRDFGVREHYIRARTAELLSKAPREAEADED